MPPSKIRSVTAALLVAAVTAIAADPPPETGLSKAEPDKRIAAPEKKLHGTWIGRGMAAPLLTFRAGGKFEQSATIKGTEGGGTWEVRRDALPPTLVMRFTKWAAEGQAGKSRKQKVIGLDDETLRFESPDTLPHQSVGYRRVKKWNQGGDGCRHGRPVE